MFIAAYEFCFRNVGAIVPVNSTITGAWRISSEELAYQPLAEEQGLRQTLPVELGNGHSNIFQLDTDLNYIETHFSPVKDLAVLSRMQHHEARMVVTLGLQGQSRFTANSGDQVLFKQGYTSITTFSGCEGAREYLGNKPVSQLRFSVSQRWLTKHLGGNDLAHFFDDSAMRLISHRPISPAGLLAAQQLLKGQVSHKVRTLFRQGQALSLLASELAPLLSEAALQPRGFTAKDRDIAHLARDILGKEFKNPPSVAELARRVGTNQFKLKQLFHHYFDNTPYGMLLSIRMEQAHQRLKTRQCPVNKVAEAVGYQHASNFSAAFARYFGFPPKQVGRSN